MANSKKEKFNYHEHEETTTLFPEISSVASATETTGMMPTLPQNRDEYRSYQNVAGMGIPKAAPGRSNNGETRRAEADNRPRI